MRQRQVEERSSYVLVVHGRSSTARQGAHGSDGQTYGVHVEDFLGIPEGHLTTQEGQI